MKSSTRPTPAPTLRVLAACAVLLGLAACASVESVPSATADLQATRGNSTTGRLQFSESGGKVIVTGEVRGLKPNAEHGFHVHEKGDCSSGDGMSTGGHFNPAGAGHGQHGHGAHHVGDLPSLKADAQGVAKVMFQTDRLSLGSGASSIEGKGLIVHRDPDDYKTQPTGNAGPRLACGVIRRN
jgi:superoxide dismutase, Cu-Zn family